MPIKGDQGTVRAVNRRLLLRLLREQGPSSRTDLADLSGLSNGAVTRIVGDLITDGLLVEQSIGVSTGGRRPVLLDVDTSARVVAGVKLMDDAVLAVLVDMKGAVVADTRLVLRSHDVRAVITRVAKAVADLLGRVGTSGERLTGLGLGMSGSIDWVNGVCRLSPFFGWTDVPVADLLRDRVGVPVTVDNDVNALAVAESLFGRGRHVRDFAVVTVGRGVGAALVHDGGVYRGATGGAGEFGHSVSEWGGRRCECGRAGCLEAYVGEPALMSRVRGLGPAYAELDVAGFLALVDRGDRRAAAVYGELTRRLGVAMATLVNLVNPELVLLGGEAGYLSDRFLTDLGPHIEEHTFNGLAGSFAVELDDWCDDRTAWARGAASLAMEHLYDPLRHDPGLAIA